VRHLFVQCPRLLPVWALVALGLSLHPVAGLEELLDGLAEHLPIRPRSVAPFPERIGRVSGGTAPRG
jgi:hypothetical protein